MPNSIPHVLDAEGHNLLGSQLELLLDRLAAAGIKIGSRERSALFMVIARVMASSQNNAAMWELRPLIAPVVARSVEQRAVFHSIFDGLFPPQKLDSGHQSTRIETPSKKPKNRNVTVYVVIAIAALAMASAAALITRHNLGSAPSEKSAPRRDLDQPTSSPANDSSAAVSPSTSAAPEQLLSVPVAPAAEVSDPLLARISFAAEKYGWAPTLRELSSELVGNAQALTGKQKPGQPNWSGESYAQWMSWMTGYAVDAPLPIYGRESSDGVIWARLALALGRLEGAGPELQFAPLLFQASEAQKSGSLPRVYRIAEELRLQALDRTPLLTELAVSLTRIPAIGPGPIEDIRRAWALNGRNPGELGLLPFGQREDMTVAVPPPNWLVPISAAVPLFCALLLIYVVLRRRPHISRRIPDVAPIHTDLVSSSSGRLEYPLAMFQRAAQKLSQRTARPAKGIDVEKTIEATLLRGGIFPEVIFAEERVKPVYLFLVERTSPSDHEASRMLMYISRLRTLIDADVYFFQRDIAELESEDGLRRLTVEYVRSAHPDHRLVILGTGVGLLDPLTFVAGRTSKIIASWERRALLTPIPISEWRKEELALASEFSMPIGRATPEGIASLSDLLKLEGDLESGELSTVGDNLARPLPTLLRNRPQRFLFSGDPGKEVTAQLVQELRNYLDGEAFEWLAALAVYPAVQWDLTLYLGLELRSNSLSFNAKKSVYTEARLAALAQLPWLRAGKLPLWLRRVLIATLSPTRSKEIAEAIEKALQEGAGKNEAATQQLRLRISRQPPKTTFALERLFDDQVMVEFLRSARAEDFRLSRITKAVKQSIRDRIHAGDIALFGSFLCFAAVAPITLPTFGMPLTTGGYGATYLLLAGMALTVFAWLVVVSPHRAQSAAERLGPGALALLFAAPICLLLFARSTLQHPFLLLCYLVVSCSSIVVARLCSEALGLRVFAGPLSGLGGWLSLTARSCALLLPLGLLTIFWQSNVVLFAGAYACLVAAFAVAYACAHFKPRSSGQDAPRSSRSGAGWKASIIVTSFLITVSCATALSAFIRQSETRSTLAKRPSLTVQAALSDNTRWIASADSIGRIEVAERGGMTKFSAEAVPRGPLAALWVGDSLGEPTLLAADVEGTLYHYNSSGRHSLVFDAVTSKPLISDASAPHFVTLQGSEFIATESSSGTRLFLNRKEVEVGSSFGPVVAIAAAGNNIFFGVLDGRVYHLDIAHPVPELFSSSTAEEVAPALTLSAGDGKLTVLRTDGSIWTSTIENDAFSPLSLKARIPEFALGFAVRRSEGTRISPSISEGPPSALPSSIERPALSSAGGRTTRIEVGTSPSDSGGSAIVPGTGLTSPAPAFPRGYVACADCPPLSPFVLMEKRSADVTVMQSSGGGTVFVEHALGGTERAGGGGDDDEDESIDVVGEIADAILGTKTYTEYSPRKARKSTFAVTAPKTVLMSTEYVSPEWMQKCVVAGQCRFGGDSARSQHDGARVLPGDSRLFALWLSAQKTRQFRLPSLNEVSELQSHPRPTKCSASPSAATNDWELTNECTDRACTSTTIYSSSRNECAFTTFVATSRYRFRIVEDFVPPLPPLTQPPDPDR